MTKGKSFNKGKPGAKDKAKVVEKMRHKEMSETNKRYRKEKEFLDSKNATESRDHGDNDLSWHVKDPQILRDIASLPFSNVLAEGVRIQDDVVNNTPVYAHYRTPGIMTLNFQPAYGANFNVDPDTSPVYGQRWTSNPLNVGMRALRAFLRSNNSGSTNSLDDIDYMQYIIAMDSVYMIWTWACRLYGYLNTFSFKNRYAPEGILGAFGITDAQAQRDLYSNMAQLRYTINTFALRMSSLAVPTVFPIIARHMWMTSNIFADSRDPKAQLYVFNPVTYYIYDETNAQLVAQDFIAQLNNNVPNATILQNLGNIFNNMLDPLLSSQSVGIMSGDILKAYTGNIFSFGSIPSDFSLVPEYREDVLPMIHNTKAYGVRLGDIKHINSWTNADSLYTLVANLGQQNIMYTPSMILNMPYDFPTPEDVLYATRFMSGTRYLGQNTSQQPVYEYICGTENIVDISLTYDPRDGVPDEVNIHTLMYLQSGASVTQQRDFYRHALELGSYFAQFDWAPYILMQYRGIDAQTGDYDFSQFSGDLCNFTTIDIATLANIHDGDFCGMYNVPYTLTQR